MMVDNKNTQRVLEKVQEYLAIPPGTGETPNTLVVPLPSSKYHNRRTEVDNINFASRKEATRYKELKLHLQAGIISDLQLQPRYPLVVNGIRVGLYIGDFLYRDSQSGNWIIEDVKGYRTAHYLTKKRLVLALYGLEIQDN